MKADKAQQIVDEVFSLYAEHGSDDYIGEPVSQIEHMCQAAQLAQEQGFDDEVILAAFFHDIGHLCEYILPVEQIEGGYGIVDHELLAGKYLRDQGFSEKIAKLAESHVSAKRFLTSTDSAYYNKLSAASKITLEQQGGRMTVNEIATFKSDPLHELYVQLRTWDDQAKLEEKPLPSLDVYKKMAFKHLLER